jgi:hypothetical protein
MPMGTLTEKRRKKAQAQYQNMLEGAQMDVQLNPHNYPPVPDSGFNCYCLFICLFILLLNLITCFHI